MKQKWKHYWVEKKMANRKENEMKNVLHVVHFSFVL